MAYNKEKIYDQAIEAITKNNLFFIEDIVAFIPCSKPTFYEFFPIESNKLNDIKELLEQNKIKTKSAIRSKLFKSEKAGELLALYRLICTEYERKMLNQQYIEQSGNIGIDDFSDKSTKELIERANAIKIIKESSLKSK